MTFIVDTNWEMAVKYTEDMWLEISGSDAFSIVLKSDHMQPLFLITDIEERSCIEEVLLEVVVAINSKVPYVWVSIDDLSVNTGQDDG